MKMNKTRYENYLQWLHDLTTALYDHNIGISTDAGEAVKAMYDKGLSVEQAKNEILKTKED